MDRLSKGQRLWRVVKWVAAIGTGLLAVEIAPPITVNSSTASLPTGGQIAFFKMLGAVVSGTAIFLCLGALEWVYRGFRPVANDPMEAGQAHTSPYGPEAQQTPVAALELRQPKPDDPTHPQSS